MTDRADAARYARELFEASGRRGEAETVAVELEVIRTLNDRGIETEAPVKLRWSGHELTARGMEADMKAGTLRLESEVNGRFLQR